MYVNKIMSSFLKKLDIYCLIVNNINGDKMLLRELQTFDVVNVIDGDKLGRIIDLEINYDTGKILSFTVSPNTFVSFFMKNKNIVIPWENVVKVGTEVIIVNHEVE